MNRYRDLFRARHGREAPPPMTADITVSHADAARAEQLARTSVAGYLRTVYDHYELLSKHFQDARGYEMYAQASTVLRDIGLEPVEPHYLDVQAWATPEQIIAKLAAHRAVIGDFDRNVCFRHAGIPYEDAASGMRLFAGGGEPPSADECRTMLARIVAALSLGRKEWGLVSDNWLYVVYALAWTLLTLLGLALCVSYWRWLGLA